MCRWGGTVKMGGHRRIVCSRAWAAIGAAALLLVGSVRAEERGRVAVDVEGGVGLPESSMNDGTVDRTALAGLTASGVLYFHPLVQIGATAGYRYWFHERGQGTVQFHTHTRYQRVHVAATWDLERRWWWARGALGAAWTIFRTQSTYETPAYRTSTRHWGAEPGVLVASSIGLRLWPRPRWHTRIGARTDYVRRFHRDEWSAVLVVGIVWSIRRP